MNTHFPSKNTIAVGNTIVLGQLCHLILFRSLFLVQRVCSGLCGVLCIVAAEAEDFILEITLHVSLPPCPERSANMINKTELIYRKTAMPCKLC